jgi:hypothetical protein
LAPTHHYSYLFKRRSLPKPGHSKGGGYGDFGEESLSGKDGGLVEGEGCKIDILKAKAKSQGLKLK